jgi:hypothetical protein
LMEEANERESESAARLQVDQSQLQAEVEFLRGENERREEALVEIRRLLDDACQRELATASQLKDEQDRSLKEIEYLSDENKRREGALVEFRNIVAETVESQVLHLAEQNQILAAMGGKSAALQSALDIATMRLSSLDEQFARERELHEALRTKAESWALDNAQLQGEVGRLHHEVAFREKEVVSLRKTIHDFQASMSWCITYPLRFCKRSGIAAAKKAAGIGYGSARVLAHILRPSMRFVARSSAVRALVVRITGIDSSLTKRARLFLFGNGPVARKSATLDTTEPSLVLTKRASQIFSELQRAKRKQLSNDVSLRQGRA